VAKLTRGDGNELWHRHPTPSYIARQDDGWAVGVVDNRRESRTIGRVGEHETDIHQRCVLCSETGERVGEWDGQQFSLRGDSEESQEIKVKITLKNRCTVSWVRIAFIETGSEIEHRSIIGRHRETTNSLMRMKEKK
jgi:hypothetical protein